MRLASERVVGIVELPAGCEEATARRIVTAAFRASAEGTVGLLVDQGARQTADRILDTLVRRLGTDVRGVLFLDPTRDLERVVAHAADGRFVVVRSARLSGELRARGIAFRTGDSGLAALEAAAGGGNTITNEPAEPRPSLVGAA